jgi:hypothetical protein
MMPFSARVHQSALFVAIRLIPGARTRLNRHEYGSLILYADEGKS